MSDLSPLRRKIGTKRPNDVPPPLTPERVWRRAVTHGLDRAIGLEAKVEKVACSAALPDAIAELADDGSLTALLDGPLGYGLIIVSSDIVGAMLEMLTLGRVQSRPLIPRAITATDSAMLADPLDRVLATQQTLVAEMGAATIASGYRFATRIEIPREIALSLDDETHDLFTIQVSAGGPTARNGVIHVALPRLPPITSEDMPVDWGTRIEARLMGAQVPLAAELARMTLSVGALQALRVGDDLPLGRHVIDRVRIVAPGGEGFAIGRLGQSGGRKAVRIGVTPDPFTKTTLPKLAAKPTEDPPEN